MGAQRPLHGTNHTVARYAVDEYFERRIYWFKSVYGRVWKFLAKAFRKFANIRSNVKDASDICIGEMLLDVAADFHAQPTLGKASKISMSSCLHHSYVDSTPEHWRTSGLIATLQKQSMSYRSLAH